MKVILHLFSKFKLLILLLMVLSTTIILLIRNYIDNYEVEDGFQLLKSSNYVAAAAKLRPLADNGNKLAQSYLVEIYTNGMDDVYSKDSEALYWCVKINQLSWYEELFNKDLRINLKLCELSFARENLYKSLSGGLNNSYYLDKFNSGLNWLKIAYMSGDKSTHVLFKKCGLSKFNIYSLDDQYPSNLYKCICDNFDWNGWAKVDCKSLPENNNKK